MPMNKTTTIKKQICDLLGITEETYVLYVEQFGYAFAWHYTMHHSWSVEYLTKAAAYWRWWNSHQYLRDETFLVEMESYKNTDSEGLLWDLWLDHHAPGNVEIMPNKKILDASYQLMLEAVNNEKEGQLK